jgi:hypothetical protein
MYLMGKVLYINSQHPRVECKVTFLRSKLKVHLSGNVNQLFKDKQFTKKA